MNAHVQIRDCFHVPVYAVSVVRSLLMACLMLLNLVSFFVISLSLTLECFIEFQKDVWFMVYMNLWHDS